MMTDVFILLVSGIIGGIINSVAGGGSFVTFPALLFVGVPPVSANATNTFASCAGYMSGAYAFRRELLVHSAHLKNILIISFVGGTLGALLLLQASEQQFSQAIPWLLLIATLLFIFGGKINDILSKNRSGMHRNSLIGLSVMLLLICIYGGFFNAGLGIITLSYLVVAGYTNMHEMNGIKLLISSAVSIIAILVFIFGGVLAWFEGSALLIGNLVGGYLAAHYSRGISQQLVRNLVIIASILITAHFFNATYSFV